MWYFYLWKNDSPLSKKLCWMGLIILARWFINVLTLNVRHIELNSTKLYWTSFLAVNKKKFLQNMPDWLDWCPIVTYKTLTKLKLSFRVQGRSNLLWHFDIHFCQGHHNCPEARPDASKESHPTASQRRTDFPKQLKICLLQLKGNCKFSTAIWLHQRQD